MDIAYFGSIYLLSFSTFRCLNYRKILFHDTVNPRLQCRSIYVPSKPAVYASIIRRMLNYPQSCVTNTVLRSGLSPDLIGYDLLGYDLRELKDWEADERLEGQCGQ